MNIDNNILYHGSNKIIENPLILTTEYTKDFGEGFYLTKFQKQAERWALRRGKKNKNAIVNKYFLDYDKVLYEFKGYTKIFNDMNEEWLDFIAESRHGNKNNFQIIEGPMADDQIYNYVENFLSGEMSRDEFWMRAKFLKPTHQIVLKDKALSCLKFIGYYIVE